MKKLKGLSVTNKTVICDVEFAVAVKKEFDAVLTTRLHKSCPKLLPPFEKTHEKEMTSFHAAVGQPKIMIMQQYVSRHHKKVERLIARIHWSRIVVTLRAVHDICSQSRPDTLKLGEHLQALKDGVRYVQMCGVEKKQGKIGKAGRGIGKGLKNMVKKRMS